MDTIDFKILKLLSSQARMTWAELSTALGLSRPATSERVKKLEDKGIIKGYSANINPEAVGIEVTAFIFVTISNYKKKDEFLKFIFEIDEIQECHHIAGDQDFILKVRCHCIADLDKLICDKFKGLDFLSRTKTNIVLCTDKETNLLPLNESKILNS